VTKSTGVNTVKPEMSSLFSKSRDPSYVCSAMCSECPRKAWRGKTCWLHPRESGPEVSKDEVAWLHLRPYLVPSWCRPRETDIVIDREDIWSS